MKKIFFTIVVLLYFSALFSQSLVVVDETNKLGIEKVIISNKSKFVETDLRGKADISILSGADSLAFNHFNHKELRLSMTEIKSMNYTVVLEETTFDLSEVLVSANKWEQNKKEVPYYISGVSKKQIQFSNSQTTADILNSTGKIFVQKSQLGGGSPMIRGFSANRVLIVVDGVRMNNAIFRSGNLQNIIAIDPETIESSEVVFGPGSVIYGSDALGGVMDFHTVNPGFSSSKKPIVVGNTSIRSSSASFEKSIHADLNIGYQKIASYTSVSFNDYDDLKIGSFGNDEYLRHEYVTQINGVDSIIQNSDPRIQKTSGYSQINMLQKIKFRLKNNSFITYNFQYSTTTDVPRYDRLLVYKKGILKSGEWYYGPQTWMVNSLKFYINSETKIYDKAKIIFAHQNFAESRNDRAIYDNELSIKREKVAVSSVNIDFEKIFGSKSIFFYGIESVYNLVNSTGEIKNTDTQIITPDAGRYPDGSILMTNAAYVNYKNNLSKNITFTSGARYSYIYLKSVLDKTYYDFPFDEIKQQKGSLTGSLGLVYRPGSTWQINTHLSSGFRNPNIDDVSKVFDSEPGKVIVPNPNLEPEYAYDVDFGIIKSFNDKILVEIVGFYTFLDNAIVREDFSFNGLDSIIYKDEMSKVQSLVNEDNARVYGVQTSLMYNISNNFQTKINYTKEFGKTKEGLPVRHVAPEYGSVFFSYKTKKMRTEFYAIYNGEISNQMLSPEEQDKTYMYATDSEGMPYSPMWYTLNIKTSYMINNFLQIQAGVENITDQRYRPYSSGIVAPGRNYILSLRASF